MVERVAAAIRDGLSDCEGGPSEDDWIIAAIAAIEAMREPTDAMEAAFVNTTVNRWATPEGLRDGYRAMIDAALKRFTA